jgi:hypothetical protein
MYNKKKPRNQDLIIPKDFWNGLWNPITGKLKVKRIIPKYEFRDRSNDLQEF